MTRPGILARLILPSAVASVALLVAAVATGQWLLAAWAGCSAVLAIAALRWAWGGR